MTSDSDGCMVHECLMNCILLTKLSSFGQRLLKPPRKGDKFRGVYLACYLSLLHRFSFPSFQIRNPIFVFYKCVLTQISEVFLIIIVDLIKVPKIINNDVS